MQRLNVIPYPALVEFVGPGSLTLPSTPSIAFSAEGLRPQAQYLQESLHHLSGTPSNLLLLSSSQQQQQRASFEANINSSSTGTNNNQQQPQIVLRVVEDLPSLWPYRWSQEGYELQCSSAGITISALSSTGVFYGIQTLLQALSQDTHGLSMPHTQVRW